MIHGNIEKALNLLRVQIHGQHAVHPGGDQQIGHQFGGDGHAGLVFAVLARVTIKRHDRRDAHGAGPAQGVNHDEQLHQIMVRGRRGRLNDENVFAADIFLDFHKGFTVGERGDVAVAEFAANVFADGAGQRLVRRAGKDFHRLKNNFGFKKRNRRGRRGNRKPQI